MKALQSKIKSLNGVIENLKRTTSSQIAGNGWIMSQSISDVRFCCVVFIFSKGTVWNPLTEKAKGWGDVGWGQGNYLQETHILVKKKVYFQTTVCLKRKYVVNVHVLSKNNSNR